MHLCTRSAAGAPAQILVAGSVSNDDSLWPGSVQLLCERIRHQISVEFHVADYSSCIGRVTLEHYGTDLTNGVFPAKVSDNSGAQAPIRIVLAVCKEVTRNM